MPKRIARSLKELAETGDLSPSTSPMAKKIPKKVDPAEVAPSDKTLRVNRKRKRSMSPELKGNDCEEVSQATPASHPEVEDVDYYDESRVVFDGPRVTFGAANL